jgi:hypothetical protein
MLSKDFKYVTGGDAIFLAHSIKSFCFLLPVYFIAAFSLKNFRVGYDTILYLLERFFSLVASTFATIIFSLDNISATFSSSGRSF